MHVQVCIFALTISALQRSWDKKHADHISDVEWPEASLPVNTVLP